MSTLYEAHNNNEAIYFHCKAGVNRSFRMTALFLTYCQIRDELNELANISELQLEDWIMENCAMIWDKRPCVCFSRDEWYSQIQAIKSMLIRVCDGQINTDVKHNSKLQKCRLRSQYELYSYRHNLKKETQQAHPKIQVVDEIIESTKSSTATTHWKIVKKGVKTLLKTKWQYLNKNAVTASFIYHGFMAIYSISEPIKKCRHVLSRLWKPEPAHVSASEKVGISFKV